MSTQEELIDLQTQQFPHNIILKGETVSVNVPSITLGVYFTSPEAELIYSEVYVPSESILPHLYWSTYYIKFGQRGCYTGIQNMPNEDNSGSERNNIFSIWDINETNSSDEPSEVKLDYACDDKLRSSNFGHEGSGLHNIHPMPWSPNSWYSVVIRRWFNPEDNHTHVGMFMYSYKDNKWTHYSTMKLPETDVSITGSYALGFLEKNSGSDLGYSGIYGQYFRMNKEGIWEKPTSYSAYTSKVPPETWNAEVYQCVNIKLSAPIGGSNNTESSKTFKVKQNNSSPENEIIQYNTKPIPVKVPKIISMTSRYNLETSTLDVSWENDESQSPQLSYSIIVKMDKNDEVIKSIEKIIPQDRSVSIPISQNNILGVYYTVILKITSIFNEETEVVRRSYYIS